MMQNKALQIPFEPFGNMFVDDLLHFASQDISGLFCQVFLGEAPLESEVFYIQAFSNLGKNEVSCLLSDLILHALLDSPTVAISFVEILFKKVGCDLIKVYVDGDGGFGHKLFGKDEKHLQP